MAYQSTAAIQLLTEVGTQLFGPQWQSPLARALEVSPRIVRYWASAQKPVPRPIFAALRELLLTRSVPMPQILQKLGEAAVQPVSQGVLQLKDGSYAVMVHGPKGLPYPVTGFETENEANKWKALLLVA